ncbi:MAG: hydroxyethylthiazole kinase [Phycisphaerales bacterium]|nr:MAG: hydroxyethylthiazole kinase [Phycisphaerales bacterium]
MIDSAGIWQDIVAIREQGPLVHNVTNLVVMDFTANALLALGASPAMAHAPREVEKTAGLQSGGPGSLRTHFLDALHNLDESILASFVRVD